MTFSSLVLVLILFGCVKKEVSPYVDQAQLTCYSGEKIIYQITTRPYKIGHPSSNGINADTWEIDTDQGKIIITGTCIYKQLNF